MPFSRFIARRHAQKAARWPLSGTHSSQKHTAICITAPLTQPGHAERIGADLFTMPKNPSAARA